MQINFSSSRSVDICLLNIRSLRNKLAQLEVMLNCQPTDILCLNEHWLLEDEVNLYVPEGFVLADFFARPSAYGGSSIFVRKDLLFKGIDVSSHCYDKICEGSAIRLINFNIVILCIYRTPDSNFRIFIENLECLLLHVTRNCVKTNEGIVLAGDLNVDLLDNKSPETCELLNVLRSFDLFPTNHRPTRVKACLDNIYTNLNAVLYESNTVDEAISDHSGVRLKAIIGHCKESSHELPNKIKRLISEDRLVNFNNILSNTDWSDLYCILDVNVAFLFFVNVICSCFNYCCPVISVKPKKGCKGKKSDTSSFKKWFSPQLENMRKWMLFLYDLWKESGSQLDKTRFKNFKKCYNSEIDKAKMKTNDMLIANAKNKCQTAWKVVRSESGFCKPNVSRPIPITPDCLNEYFINVSNTVKQNVNVDIRDPSHVDLLMEFDRPIPVEGFSWQYVNSTVISKVLASLSGSRSEDIYGFSNNVIKTVGGSIVAPLTFLINLVLEQGVFPDCLKLSNVTPVFKKGDSSKPECYRPITIVPILSKVIESCVFLQLYDYFNKNELLYKHQYGFRPKHNTVLAIEEIVDFILNNFENKHYVAANLIDLTKAFDCLSFDLLYKKLYFYGIRGKELNFIKSYLSERQQKVVVNNTSSGYLDVFAGVPQGSVLGPFLYLIFVNDFYCTVPCLSILYADDTTLLCSDSDFEYVQNIMSDALSCAKRWFELNDLCINESKTELIYFSLKEFPADFSIVNDVKLLGFTLDNQLSWEPHILNLCKKLSRIVFLLRKLKSLVSLDTLLMVYYGLFHSLISYGIRLWGSSCHVTKIFIWQKKAVRAIDGLTSRQSCKSSFLKLKIITVPSLYILSNLIHVQQNLCNFKVQNEGHDHLTRGRNNLVTPHVRLAKTLKSHVYQQLKLYNKLPLAVRTMPVNSFKKTVSEWIKNQAFYTVDEYMDYQFL